MIDITLTAILVSLILIFIAPVSVYLSAKLGTYAHLKMKERLERERSKYNGEKQNQTKEKPRT